MTQSNRVLHLKSIPTNCSTSLTQFGCNGVYLAAPLNKTTVGVWSLQSLESKPLELVAHKNSPSSVSFGRGYNPTSLCTAAEDYVIVWNVEKVRTAFENGQAIRGQIVARHLGTVEYTSFNLDDSLLALCIEREIHILKVQTQELHTLLEGHAGLVTCAEFCDHRPNVIVTCSEDRTFKIWDLDSSSLVYESSIISAYPFLNLAIDPYMEVVALGSADGLVRVFNITDGSGYRLLHQLDVGKLIEKKLAKRKEQLKTTASSTTISSKPSWHRPTHDEDSECSQDYASSQSGEAILSIRFHQNTNNQDEMGNVSWKNKKFLKPEEVVDHLVWDSSYLLVATSGTLSVIHTKSFEGDTFLFQDSVQTAGGHQENKHIPVAKSFAFASSPDLRKAFCVSLGAFHSSLEVLEIDFPAVTNSQSSVSEDFTGKLSLSEDPASSFTAEGEISVVASIPLLDNSILRSEMIAKKVEARGSRGGVTATSKSKSSPKMLNQKGIQDQPLTFHAKIKSSGYSSTARTKMFSPKTSQEKNQITKKKAPTASGTKKLLKEFPMTSDPPSLMKYSLAITDRQAPVVDLNFSGDGQFLACALGDKSAQVLKMPMTGKATCLTGHNGSLNTISWSHDNAWLITSSCDKTAKVWMRGSSDHALTLGHVKHSQQNDGGGNLPSPASSSKKDNPCFTKEINHAQFYYVDKFIVLSSGSSFYLYKYNLDTSVNDIKRYESRSKYRLVKQFAMEDANLVTSMSAANGFYSHLVFCCGSDKSIELFDLNVGSRLSKIKDAHSRSINHIVQNLGSNFASLIPSACNLFATSAVTDGIKVWDARTNRCVRKLEGHVSRSHSCGITFSPCGRYLVTGSEDKAAYIFDIKEGAIVDKLSGHRDVVTCVTYHPLYAEVVSGTLDGTLQLYSNR